MAQLLDPSGFDIDKQLICVYLLPSIQWSLLSPSFLGFHCHDLILLKLKIELRS